MFNIEKVNLVVSCPNDGGLVHIDHGTPICIDKYSTAGICVHNDKLFRCIQNAKDTPLRMIVYGKESTLTLVYPQIGDVHDILYHDGGIYIVATGSNEIFEVSASTYEVLNTFKLRGKGDAWHLNCLEAFEDKLLVSAFGKFRKHRKYKGRTKQAGIVFDLYSGETLLKGLSQPHSPKIIDGRLFLCNSEDKTVYCIDPKTKAKTILQFENYTRGIAFSDEHIYVGVSSSRNVVQEATGSKVVVLDRGGLERMHEIQLQFSEIYSICTIPNDLQIGLL